MSKVVSRIGITPVGSVRYRINRLRLHLLAYTIAQSAKLHGSEAEFIVRCDDTNKETTNKEYLDAYLQTLSEIGVNFDTTPYDKDRNGYPMFQSQRSKLYKAKVDELLDKGLAYRESDRSVFFDVSAYIESHQSLLHEDKLLVKDAAMGSFLVDVKSADRETAELMYRPFPIQRLDGSYLFNLCSPLDDAAMSVTHVVRDRNKLSVLGMQEMVRTALHLPEIIYLHAPLIMNDLGTRYIQDDLYGDGTYESFLEAGFTSKAIISYILASIEGEPEAYYRNLNEFAISFDITKIHQAHTRFSNELLKIHQFNSIKEMSNDSYKEAFEKRLAIVKPDLFYKYQNDQNLQKFLLLRKENLVDNDNFIALNFKDDYNFIDKDLMQIAKKVETLIALNNLGSSKESLIGSFETCNASFGISKKDFYMSLRVIYTGKTHGVGLIDLLSYLEKSGELESRLAIFKQFIGKE